MKHSLKFFIALFITASLWCCKDKDQDVNTVSITVTPESLDFTPQEQTQSLSIQTDGVWIVSCQQDWIQILTPTGSGNGTANIKALVNSSMSAREATVYVASNKTTVPVSIRQDGMDISVSATTIKATEKSAVKTIVVTCDNEWSAESDSDWCTVEKDGNTLSVNIAYNETTEAREANITITTQAGTTVVITVTQSKGNGQPEPTFSVSSQDDFELPIKDDGQMEVLLFEQTYTIDVTTPSNSSVWDVEVTYTDGASEFLTCKNIYSRVGGGSFTFTTKKNLTRQTREALLKIICNTNGEIEFYDLNVKQLSYDLQITSAPVINNEYGAEQSFGITVSPEMELKYSTDVDWITNISDDVFRIEDNMTPESRTGKIYINLAQDDSMLDSIEITQRDGVQQAIPFACNSYVTPLDPTAVQAPSCASSILSGGYVGSGNGGMTSATAWKKTYDSQNIQLSFYFRTETPGALNLGLVSKMSRVTDTARVEVIVGDISHEVEITGNTVRTWPVGKFNVDKVGYVRVDIRGTYTNTTYYPYITDVYVGGECIKYEQDKTSNLTYVTTKQIEASDAHWIKRGPSCHLSWVQPSGSMEYFYNEINVPLGEDVPSAYFMTTGGSGFYMGIQPNVVGSTRCVLFSVWNNETNPNDIQYSEIVRYGEKSKPNSFGHEGSGIQTWRYYDWVAGKTYATLAHVRPEVVNGVATGNTLYTGYFWSEEFGWELIAEIRRPGMKSYYTGAYSFSENFGPHNGFVTRSVDFPNQWMRTSDGVWHEVLSARVTADGTGTGGLRTDFYGGVRDGHFYLQNIGYFDQKIQSGTYFSREASGKSAPEIDLEALSKLGIWVNP